jgi:hypothetical protein
MYGYPTLDTNVGKKSFIKMIELFFDLGLVYSLFAIIVCLVIYILYLNNVK